MTGFRVFDSDPETRNWAAEARDEATRLAADPDIRAANLRQDGTWFVGVDVLPNAPDGSLNGVPLRGPWLDHITAPDQWHRAQVSIVYRGYPRQDVGESDAGYRFRVRRHAAHVDGLLAEGPERRRFLREPHGFILGLPLNDCDAAPLMVWPGSHCIMGEAFRALIGDRDPVTCDLTDGYAVARRAVFDRIAPVAVRAKPGQAILLHRHLLHGVAPWDGTASRDGVAFAAQDRAIAYLRPQISASAWLAA